MRRALHDGMLCILMTVFILFIHTGKAQAVLQRDRWISQPDSVRQKIKQYYSKAIKYKNGVGTPIDYKKAFANFKAAADLGDAQSVYAEAYFYYKGFVEQDYAKAAALFKQGAYGGRENSQYFWGLMLLNGFGVAANQDSGRYWLQKSADGGYQQSIQELQMHMPENNEDARNLLARIKDVELPNKNIVNQFISVTPQLPDSIAIGGHYAGYIITYDWSGKYVVSAQKLKLTLSSDPTDKKMGQVKGQWMQQDAATAPIKANLNGGVLLFDSAHYSRTDHYSPNRAIRYNLERAVLQLVRHGDSIFLTGDVTMFSPQRNEPSKPTMIALVKTDNLIAAGGRANQDLVGTKNRLDSAIAIVHKVRKVNVYPNPFDTYLQVEFEVVAKTKIRIELYTMTGKLIYEKLPEVLAVGKYSIRIKTNGTLPGQSYILRLIYDGGMQATKVIRK